MTQVITGDKALDRKLLRLGEKAAKKITRSADGKMLTVLARGIRKEVPAGETKTLKKSIGKRNKKNKRKGIYESKVGVNVGKRGDKHAPHAHLPALGTVERFHQSGKSTGSVSENNFVERGVKNSLADAKARFIQAVREGIEKEARKS